MLLTSLSANKVILACVLVSAASVTNCHKAGGLKQQISGVRNLKSVSLDANQGVSRVLLPLMALGMELLPHIFQL